MKRKKLFGFLNFLDEKNRIFLVLIKEFQGKHNF